MKLDHLVIAAPTLEMGAAWFFQETGVLPVAGGKHALMGTHNLLARLEGETYLELIAIDPNAPAPARARWFGLDSPPTAPKLIHWVARSEPLQAVRPLEPLGTITPITRGSFSWNITIPDDGQLVLGGLVPTLIEWQSQHPTALLPDSGLRVQRLEGIHPDPARVQANLKALGLELPVGLGETPQLKAVLETPKGLVNF
jgi:Glyoxalase-like domain